MVTRAGGWVVGCRIWPRSGVSFAFGPSSAYSALAPSATTSFGCRMLNSAPSHQAHRLISPALGFECSRRLPRGVMLDRIGDITALTIEQPAGGADKGPAGHILLISRLLSDEHALGFHRAFAEDVLRGILVESQRVQSSA